MQDEANSSKRTVRARAVLLLGGCALALGALAAWRPGTPNGASANPDALVVQAAGWAAWALTIYLVIGVAGTAVGYLRVEPMAMRGLAPGAVRRCVDVVVGASSAAALCLTPALAYADAPPPAPVAGASPLDWPGLSPSAPDPAQAGSEAPATTSPHVPADAHHLVVRPGDSLWSLTARHLGPQATAAQIATEWPRLYAANRAAIGPDPDLIHPGQHLVDPAGEGTHR